MKDTRAEHASSTELAYLKHKMQLHFWGELYDFISLKLIFFSFLCLPRISIWNSAAVIPNDIKIIVIDFRDLLGKSVHFVRPFAAVMKKMNYEKKALTSGDGNLEKVLF